MAASDFEQVVEESHLACGEFVKGDPKPLKKIYSHQDDVSLANPFGPPMRGWKQAAETIERAASNYRDGEVTGFENIAKYATRDLAYMVEVEQYKARIAGREDIVPLALRVTSIFRPEDGVWKLVHRHADPIPLFRQ